MQSCTALCSLKRTLTAVPKERIPQPTLGEEEVAIVQAEPRKESVLKFRRRTGWRHSGKWVRAGGGGGKVGKGWGMSGWSGCGCLLAHPDPWALGKSPRDLSVMTAPSHAWSQALAASHWSPQAFAS